MWWNRGALSLCLALLQCVHVQLPPWASWSRSTFLPGFKDISRVCVPQLGCMAAIVSRAVRPDPPSPRNKSKTLLDTRAQAGWRAHSPHSCTLPLWGPWALPRGAALPDEQTELCVRGRVDKHLSLWVHPRLSVCTGNWAAMLAPYASMVWALVFRWKSHPLSFSGFLGGWVQTKAASFSTFTRI